MARTTTPHVSSSPLHSLMRYKAWADADLIEAALAVPGLPSTEDGFYITAIIRHFHTVDCIFRAHLLGIEHGFTSPNPMEPRALSELQQRMKAIDRWYVEYARSLAEPELSEALTVTFTDGDRQVLTRADILLHVSLHGAAHRLQVGILLRKLGTEPPPDRYTSYLARLELGAT